MELSVCNFGTRVDNYICSPTLISQFFPTLLVRFSWVFPLFSGAKPLLGQATAVVVLPPPPFPPQLITLTT